MADSHAPLIEGKLKHDLQELAEAAAPNEVAGIIYQDTVHMLENTSTTPETDFRIQRDELRALVIQLGIPWEDLAEKVVFWHSHPNGGVGPSRTDMKHKTPLKHHLVVSLVDGDLVATWY